MRSKKAIKNIVSSLFQQLVVVICGLILPRAIIRNFGSNVNGLISSITQFLSYITLLEAGIGPVIKSVLYKPIANKDKNQIEKILKSAQKFFNVISYIFIGYLIILCFVYPTLVNAEFSKGYTISLLIIISISTFAEYFFGMVYKLYLQAEQKTYITANIQSITTIFNTVFSVILIKFGVNIQIVKLVSAFIFVLRPIIQNIYVKKKYSINLKNITEKYELKQKWDGLAQHIAAVIYGNTDITLLTIFSNTLEVSVYGVYSYIVKGVHNLVQGLTGGIDASFGDMYAKDEQENLNKNFKIYEFAYFTMITIVYICTFCLILPFIQIYTKGITDTNYYRPIFAYIIVISEYMWAIRLPYSSLTLAVGHFKETQKGAWLEAINNIVISTILVIKFGINGVAIGTLVSTMIRTFEFISHASKQILVRKQFYAYSHLFITAIETILVSIIIKCIIKNVVFENYFIWIQYAIISLIISVIIVGIINSLVYRNDMKMIIKILKNNLKRGKNNGNSRKNIY